MGKPRIFLHDKIYIPVTEVSEKRVVKEYTHYEFDDNICRGCPMRHQRPCADCRECEWGGLKTSFLLANRKTNNGKAYYTIPMGDFENVERKLRIDFDDFKVIDRTKRIPFDHPIKFTSELYDYQEDPVKRIKRFKMGILKSKPRTGKCVVGSEMVDTSYGLLDMRALWREFGDDSKESVELNRSLTTNTAYGSERISWIHRKKSKTIAMTSHIGHELAATPEHPVFVVTPDLQVEERRMDELRIGDWIVSIPNTSLRMRQSVKLTSIPESKHTFTKKITQPTHMSDDLAFVLGCLVANGSLASARAANTAALRFSSNDHKVSSAYASKVESLFGVEAKVRNSDDRVSEIVVYSSQLVDWLTANGLSMATASGKSIPECVLRSGRGVHRAFLSGYLSCDSSVYDNYIEQITASKTLHKQLAVMFMSLGCVATARVTNKAATNGSGIKRPYYCLTLTANNRRKLTEQVQITKPVNVSRSTNSKEFSDVDMIPYVVSAINSLDGSKKQYYEGKPSQNAQGNLARNTLLRVKRETLPEHMQDFLSYADGVFFQRVDKLEHRDSDWVYDLTVEGSHTFVASGFMVHNTVMAVASMCKLGLRTIIMADQKDFLDGFYETIEQMTNLPALEEKTGRKLFGFPKKLEDFENFQVVLVTYQSLIKNTSVCKKRLKALRKNYGALFVDEVHRTCAPEFTKVLGKMTTRVRIGLSATPRRKDKREILAYHTIGPVIAKTDADVMKPEISVHYSPESVRSNNQFSGQAGWTKFCQFLAKHEDRNMSIVQRVVADLKAGRNVVIPIMFKDHAAKLKREIDFAWGDEICATFLGGSKNSKLRKSIVDNARSGKIRCVIGIRRLVQIGINVPQWDTLYYVMPMNNAPNWEQESYRILTPLKDKKQPMIRMFVDRYMMRSLGCFKSTLQTSMRFGHALRPKTQKVLDNDFGRSFYTPTKNSYEKPERERSIMGRTF